MRIVDKIANEILTMLEDEGNLKVDKENYLTMECGIADKIQKELRKWLNYDIDLNEFSEAE